MIFFSYLFFTKTSKRFFLFPAISWYLEYVKAKHPNETKNSIKNIWIKYNYWYLQWSSSLNKKWCFCFFYHFLKPCFPFFMNFSSSHEPRIEIISFEWIGHIAFNEICKKFIFYDLGKFFLTVRYYIFVIFI